MFDPNLCSSDFVRFVQYFEYNESSFPFRKNSIVSISLKNVVSLKFYEKSSVVCTQDREYSLPVHWEAEVALVGDLVFGGQGVQLTFPETPPG